MNKIKKALNQRLPIEGRHDPWKERSANTGMYVPEIGKRWFRAFFILFITLCFSCVHAAKLIIEPEMGKAPIVEEIESAKHSVKLVMYNLTDKELLNALVQQQRDGHQVQIILEKKPFRTEFINKKTISKLKREDIAWLGSVPGKRFIHQKTLLIDHHEAMVMTFNFTHSAFKDQRNFALVLDDPAEVNDIAQHFNADWHGESTYQHSNNLVWSPDNSRKKIIELITSAKNELHIYAQTVADTEIIAALEKAADRGVKVSIITSSKPNIHGAKIISHAPYYIHAKVFIIDNHTALIGSINLTKNSLDQNRELAVITRDPQIIQQLQSTFAADSL